MTNMNPIYSEFNQKKYHFFVKIMVAWYLFDSAYSIAHYERIFGVQSIFMDSIVHSGFNSLYGKLISLLTIEELKHLPPLFLCIQMGTGLRLLFQKIPSKIIAILFYFISLNLQTPLMYGLDGGNNLINILFSYFLIFDYSSFDFLSSKTKRASSNITLYLTMAQVILVYLVAGFSKVKGDLWINGTALFYIMQNPQYFSTTFSQILIENEKLLILANYLTILFQIFIPLILFKPTRNIFIVSGVFLHLSICAVLGLLQFGLIMGAVYFLFIDEKTYKLLQSSLRNLNGKVSKLSRRKEFRSVWGVLSHRFH
ncbi:MAG: HTTM domain-containing protein [Halobacteriovoraceae bacterium]|nr:HTTM domain-containing protein [Halobacteriovoraceae bacterium]